MSIDLHTIAVNSLNVALGYADAHTLEQGNNRGDQVEFFQKMTGGSAGDSWCADFVYTCLVKSFCTAKGYLGADARANRQLMISHANEFSTRSGVPRSGYCPTVAAAAKKAGRFHTNEYAPVAGDLILYDFHGQGEPHHVGFVISKNVDGTIRTVEGNTGPGDTGSQGDGDGVYKRTRPRTHVYGFVHLEGLI